MSRHLWIAPAMGLAIGLATAAGTAQALDAVTFGTSWKAQAEHGGFYQAVADGIYETYGLDVTIRPGGPQELEPTWTDLDRARGCGPTG